MKTLFTCFFCFFILSLSAQESYYTKSGQIDFESSVPTFEEVKASNSKVTAILKKDGAIAALALVKGFRFKVALMEEHFNENYAESDTHPKTSFSGSIQNFDVAKLTDAWAEYTVKGTLSFHGVSKEVELTMNIKKTDGIISLSSSFQLKPEDYNIKIPSIVRKKIAAFVDVSLAFELKAR